MFSFHIEPTSKCTLECPLCDRTWFYETFKKRPLQEIDVTQLVKFVGSNARIKMCGNNGDPIYHSQFHTLCDELKRINCKITIVTNGSFRSKIWWQKLSSILNADDRIVFSIDGLEDTNHLYRKNSNWQSIMNAVSVVSQKDIKMTWKFIVFKHNQHQIKQAEILSKKLGFENFLMEKSDRWLGNKELIPDEKYIDGYFEHQSKVLNDTNYSTDMLPECINNKNPNNIYIDAEGNFYPCCWMATFRYRYKSVFSPKGKKLNISNNTIAQIFERKEIINFYNSTKHFDSAHECCKIQCGVKNG